MTDLDDNLLRDIGAEVLRFGVRAASDTTISYNAVGGQLVDSPAGQRLRAAWTAEVDQVNGKLIGALRETENALDQTRRERDEVRAIAALNADAVNANADMITRLRAEVERLRAAALVLPDVGPVSRDAAWLCVVDPTSQRPRQVVSDWTGDEEVLRMVAEGLAVLAKRAAERAAADTTTDDEVAELGEHIMQTIRDYEAEPYAVANVVMNLVETFQDAYRTRRADTSGDETSALLASPANAARLTRSLEHMRASQTDTKD